MSKVTKFTKAVVIGSSTGGPKALDLCGQLEIDVYVNEARTAEKIFELWRSNKLKKANPQDACEQHKL